MSPDTTGVACAQMGRKGPSPHTRGSRWRRQPQGPSKGSIPAYAGQPRSRRTCCETRRVHPRIRGAAAARRCWRARSSGPSPHTRGSPSISIPVNRKLGSIPAYAGQPRCFAALRIPRRVHPRIRGAALVEPTDAGPARGPSPHTRGSRICEPSVRVLIGSIPAYAGQPWAHHGYTGGNQVHPRIRGAACWTG